MSLAFNAGFPSVSPLAVVVGAGYSQLNSYFIQRPLFAAFAQKAESSESARDTLHSTEAQTLAVSLATNLAASSVQSYALTALLHLANVVNYKGAAVVGTLVLATQSGPKFVADIINQREPIDVILTSAAVKFLDTVGLSLFLHWYTRQGGVSLPKVNLN